MTYDMIIDSYTLRRGAPTMLELSCAKCNHYICSYQKDGPGPLLRCYWDRIHAPEELKKLIQTHPDNKELDLLLCSYCKEVIGKKGMYDKEPRLIFILTPGSFLMVEVQ